MAESIVNNTPSRYFCHKCIQEINPILPVSFLASLYLPIFLSLSLLFFYLPLSFFFCVPIPNFSNAFNYSNYYLHRILPVHDVN